MVSEKSVDAADFRQRIDLI